MIAVLIANRLYMHVQSKYMTKQWQPKHDKLVAEATRKLTEFEASHPNLSDLELVQLYIIM